MSLLPKDLEEMLGSKEQFETNKPTSVTDIGSKEHYELLTDKLRAEDQANMMDIALNN